MSSYESSSIRPSLEVLEDQDTYKTADIDVILIPGLDSTTKSSQMAVLQSSPWKDIFFTETPVCRFSSFNYQINVDNQFTWQRLLSQGEILLECIYNLWNSEPERVRPLMFICHCFGGVILKQALSIANQQHRKYINLLNIISGIVFLGSPHGSPRTVPDVKEIAENASMLLKLYSHDISSRTLAKLEKESSFLSNAAERFEDVMLRVDIVSVYETKVTKIKEKGLFSKSRSILLVDKKYATTNAPREKLMPAAVDHNEILLLREAEGIPHEDLRDWIAYVIRNAQTTINDRLKAYQSRSSPTETSGSWSDHSLEDSMQYALQRTHTPEIMTEDAGPQSDTRSPIVSDEPEPGSSLHDFELLPILDGFSVTRHAAKLPCFMLQNLSRNPNFFGRQDVFEKLDLLLLPSNSATVSSEGEMMKHVSLCGMGGLGKTEIAVEWAYSRRDMFDAVFWIRADEQSKMESDFASIATSLELDDTSEAVSDLINRDLAKGWLSNPKKLVDNNNDTVGQAEATWLMILDNADNPEIIENLKPIFGSGSILITSRDPLSKTSFSLDQVGIDLEPFSEEEAGQFLRTLSQGSENEALAIARRLGCLPMALSQMAGVIRHQYLSYSEFLDMYEDETSHAELHKLTLGPQRATARGNLASIWAIDRLSPQARTLLEYLAFLDPDCIQERIFLDKNAPKFDGLPQRLVAWNTARGELLQISLIQRNDQTKDLRIHRLLQDSVKSKMSTDRLTSVFQNLVKLLLSAWPTVTLDQRHSTSRWGNCSELYPHVLCARNFYQSRFQSNAFEPNMDLAVLLNEAGWHVFTLEKSINSSNSYRWQHEKGNSHNIKPFLSYAQEICSEIDSLESRKLTCDIHHTLAAVANESNDRVSCLYHSDMNLKIRLQDLEQGATIDLPLGIAYNQRGIALMMDGQYQAAQDHFNEGISIIKKLPNFWKGMIGFLTANLGCSYWMLGNLDKAYEVLFQGLKDREELFGPNDTDSIRTGRILHGLGNVRWSQGRLDESEIYHRRALAQAQATVGNLHHRFADICHRVAQHCLRKGEYDHALQLIEQALKIWFVDSAIYRPEIARTTFLQAKVLYETKDTKRAAKAFSEATRLRKMIEGASEKASADLREEDFDCLVTFWSR